MPTGLLTGLCSTGFLKPRSTNLRMLLPSVDWAPQHQLVVKAMAQDVPTGQSHLFMSSDAPCSGIFLTLCEDVSL